MIKITHDLQEQRITTNSSWGLAPEIAVTKVA
jgi:hypothetical protein